MTSTRPDFPHVIDSSIMAAAHSCFRKAELEYIQHWKPQGVSVHLHAGGAYAKGMEVARTSYYVDNLSPEDSIAKGVAALCAFYGDFECPPDSAKSCERTAGALEFYFSRYPLGEDDAIPITLASGKRGIEFSFVEPLDIDHPSTGDPILYCGRMDMIADKQGMRLGEDDKTASQLGASWPRQWDLRSQFTGYVWGARKNEIALNGFLIRGVSILKTKYDTLEAITYRPEWQIDRWYKQLIRDIKRLIACWQEGYFDYNLDNACNEYGGCPFKGACAINKPELLLEAQFERRYWDPITRQETLL